MKLVTTLNSLYEIDEDRKRFRRVSGAHPNLTGSEDGEWVHYTSYERLVRGVDEESGKVQYAFWLGSSHLVTSLVQCEVER